MELIKYQHACMVLRNDNGSVVIDPGVYTTDFAVPMDVLAVFITHRHPDHLDVAKLREIVAKNPDCHIYAGADVASEHIDDLPVELIGVGRTVCVSGFKVDIVGGKHAVIHQSIGQIANFGLVFNDGVFYYPGDSLFIPSVSVKTLALPASAPWMKISETMDFLTAVKPDNAFPVHDAILSPIGQGLVDGMLSITASESDVRYERLQNGDAKAL